MTSVIPALRAALHALWADDDAAARRAFEGCFAHDCAFYFSHPANEPRDAWAEVYAPLRAALPHARRRDEIFIAGANRREVGGQWIAAFTHYAGTFAAPLWNIAPSNRLAFLRSGEFYRVEGGQIIEARIILDLPDLMRQAGHDPFGELLGTEMLFPGPATHDGILPAGDGVKSLDLIEAMLGDLHIYDPETGTSKGQTGEGGYWADDMLWYGPGGIGSNYRWEGFVKDHRAPFLAAFPDRKGGNHYARIGQGNYAAISGWPSMTMTHRGPYLGVEPTGKSLTLRVMDFYRCADGQIAENWVMLDYMDLFHQMGIDLIAKSNAQAVSSD
ncbi:ester cyclase [Tateyamaria sp. ANG-S1]|uniref:ester cyclase n=1 Tax=Tateyamaria sp. ANG-S1 TaxID=1577905 RepID=UPI0009E51C8A|nr:ester cyclase [Tateyamaria sp. ANG-S1]